MTEFPLNAQTVLAALPADVQWAALRLSREITTHRLVRDDLPQANATSEDAGAMCEVLIDGHFGYAATSDTTEAGLQTAFARASATTRAGSARKAHTFAAAQRPPSQGTYRSPRVQGLDVSPGTLAEQDILGALGSGLYLSNLHNLNWSDPVSARVTGMTRYACFWVEGGEIIGPINNLRWDESLYNALGPQLLALGSQAEISPEVGTYSKRSPGGSRAPGALIEAFHFTL